jgi:hypothetical protein
LLPFSITIKMVFKQLPTIKYMTANGVERLVMKMSDVQVRQMLEDKRVNVRQIWAASKARNLTTYGEKESVKKNLLLYLNGSKEGKKERFRTHDHSSLCL